MVSLPDWLDPLPDAGEQRALDEWAIDERGIPGLELMERAGTGLADLVGELAPAGRIVVVCGKGNNGGDGFVAARLLRERGREVDVLLLGDVEELRGDARVNAERLPGPAPGPFAAAALDGAAAIVDAILGTGFAGEPREPAAGAIEAINDASSDAGPVVVACDVPSGVDASTGEVAGAAVSARATATFHAAKPGLWIDPGKSRAGEVRVIDIGIPQGGPGEPQVGLISDRVSEGIPRRGRSSNKFAAGSVLVCGGSLGLTGAPCLASESAMRAGAGYVTAFVPSSLNLIFESRLLEVMTVPLPDTGGSLEPRGVEAVLERADRADALVLGPGLGRVPGAQELARQLAVAAPVPLLLDADGLNAHAGALGRLADRQAATVLTPHAGELARLLETDSAGDRRAAARRRAAGRARGSGDRGAQGRRHDRRGAGRPGGRQPRRRSGARHRGHRRRALGRDRRIPGQADGPVPRGLRGGARARPRRDAGRARGRARGRDRQRRDRNAPARAGGAGEVNMPLRALARVNLAAIERNVARLRGGLTGGAELGAVVKADGYGHGPLPAARAALAGGARSLAVATAGEAAELRDGGVQAAVLVMGALSDEELAVALAAGAELVAWSEQFVDAVRGAARGGGAVPARVHVKLDTGLGRLGTRDPDEAIRVAEP